MILDSSAVVAIVLKEPGHEALIERMLAADTVGIGAPTLSEAALVLAVKLAADPTPVLYRLLQVCAVEVVPFGEVHAQEAYRAYLRFGRRRHADRLNFGDCLAYATAKLAGQPLLCVGEDFPKTDLDLG